MGYYIDLNSITLDEYKLKLEKSYMIPSRRILQEKTDERFSQLKKLGIKNVYELHQLLKKKDKLTELSKLSCFQEEYLAILLRELNSIQPRPNKLKEFVDISDETVKKLEALGIKDTFKLFDKIKTPEDRKKLSKLSSLDENEILKLAKLTDLSRIKWVGATFAWVLYKAGFDSVEKVSKANYEELYEKVKKLNQEKNLYKGQIGLNDMKLCVEVANDVSLEIIY